jgi:hypothetical protein
MGQVDLAPEGDGEGYLLRCPNPLSGDVGLGDWRVYTECWFGGAEGEGSHGNFQIAIEIPGEEIFLNYTVDRDDWNIEFWNGSDAMIGAFFGNELPVGEWIACSMTVTGGTATLDLNGEPRGSMVLATSAGHTFAPEADLTVRIVPNGEDVRVRRIVVSNT